MAIAANTTALTPRDIANGDTAWVLMSTALVLLMTPGLSFFYGGLVKERNLLNTMMMSIVSMGAVSVLWAAYGFTLAFGDGGPLIGTFKYQWLNELDMAPFAETVHECQLATELCEAISRDVPGLLFATFQMTFAIIAAAIMSGSLVERVRFGAYVVFIVLWCLVVYVPLCHWVWGPGGWLGKMGALDFAGGTVVHISSGVSGLVAALVLGPRSPVQVKMEKPHNVPFVLLGASLLWFGWTGFNSGSALAADVTAVQALACTYLAAASSMMTWVSIEWCIYARPTSVGAMLGAVAGLVVITPAAGFVTPRGALAMGCIGAPICFCACGTVNRILNVDDSLDAFGLHGVGGFVGATITGMFAVDGGLFYGGGFTLLGKQVVGALAGAAYSAVCTYVIFIVLSLAMRVRVTEDHEREGIDEKFHGEAAYARTPTSGVPTVTDPMNEVDTSAEDDDDD